MPSMPFEETNNGSKLSENSTSHTDQQNKQNSRGKKFRIDPDEVYKPLRVYHQKKTPSNLMTKDVQLDFEEEAQPEGTAGK
jgi:hypothetical protein